MNYPSYDMENQVTRGLQGSISIETIYAPFSGTYNKSRDLKWKRYKKQFGTPDMTKDAELRLYDTYLLTCSKFK